ncbi:hypothetical protein SAMN05421866_1873 [Chryseobacterium oranimense]|uniref:Uncharacterized protein n=1 Tax=Chryseobacterium oranimense TaxID=421058 RepID=A0A1M5PM65_9FLAO|nr:hypothetical protein [Chryseobacterium oranimense]SHH02811.1 hypothetical protein SAMN05421866_1873 [Chryseobacterium oranimense]
MDKINIESLLHDFNKERDELGKIIFPIVERYNLPQKELIEVCQVGKFIYKLNENLVILDKPNPPKPDFILKNHSKLIGLEHTRIFSENSEKYNRIRSLFEYSEKVFAKLYPNETVFASINIYNDSFEYKQSQKRELAENIAQYIQSLITNQERQKPDFIENIKLMRHSNVSFNFDEANWQGPYLTNERLNEEIKKKEAKLEIYKRNESEISEYWLILLIGSLSSVSYQLSENEDYKNDSEFDRVYLMTDFDAKIIRVK